MNLTRGRRRTIQIQTKLNIQSTSYAGNARIFSGLAFTQNKIFLTKAYLMKTRSDCNNVSFASKLVNNSIHRESMNNRENSKIARIFLRKRRNVDFHSVFKDSLWLESLTNLDVKGAKRMLLNWLQVSARFFFKNVIFYVNARLSKIRSLHKYSE